MTDSFGLNDKVFKKKFRFNGNYTTTDDVRNEINKYFPSSTGTVQRLTIGHGLSVSEGPSSNVITSSGTISLNANFDDLSDVSATTANNNDVISWNGTSWVPTAPGLLTGILGTVNISDLSNVGSFPGTDQNNIITSDYGSDILNIRRNFFLDTRKIIDGEGVQTTVTHSSSDLSSIRLQTNLGSIPITYNNHPGHHFAITDENLEQRRIPSDRIPFQNFLNSGTSPFINHITFTGINTGSTPFSFISNGPSVQIGVCMGDFDYLDLSSAYGFLPIAQGGTNGITEEEARTNLGLSLNTDVMTCTGPIFNGWMTGENIGLCSGTCIYTYFNMGTTITGAGACGFRFDETSGFIQFQNTPAGWHNLYPGLSPGSSISELIDVDVTTAGVSDILIYDNTGNAFKNKPVTGFITLDKDGVTGLSGTASIPANQIFITGWPGTSISGTEFSYLSGVCSGIQEQLNNRVQYVTLPTHGDILYYSNITSGASTVNVLPKGLDHQVITLGTSLPEWRNVYHSFENLTDPYDNVGVFNDTGTSGFQTSKSNFLNGIIGTSFGIANSGSSLALHIRGVSPSVSIDPSDLLYFENPSGTDYRRNITLENFSKNFTIPDYPTVTAVTVAPPNYSLAYFTTYNQLGIYVSGAWKGVSMGAL